MFHVEHPTLRDWTRAHSEPDNTRRLRAISFLHDRMVASRMGPLKAWLYLHRHAFGAVLIGGALATYALLIANWTGWLVAAWIAYEVFGGRRG